jgi:hypothetical protein
MALLLLSMTARAAVIEFVPSVGVGMSTLDFHQKLPNGDTNNQNGDFTIAYVSGAFIVDRIIVNASMDIPFNDDHFYRDNPLPQVNGVSQVGREDYNVTFGYAVRDWVTVFTGWSIGITEFTSTTQPNNMGYISRHDDSGPFAGVSIAYNMGDNGSVGFDVAYASFNSEINNRTPDPALTSLNHQKIIGDTTGLSYGVQWNSTPGKLASYFVKIRIRDYRFDAQTSNKSPGPVNLEIDKNFTMFIVGVSF